MAKSAAVAVPYETRRLRSVVTPEGVDLKLRIADAGERAGAFLIDLIIQVLVLTVMSLVALMALLKTRGQGAEIYAVIWLIGAFALRNAYFVTFEMGPRAATPGKRMMGLRVAARSGGRLTAEAVFARNALREIEIFLPLSFLFAGGSDVDGWIKLAGMLWTGIFLFFPLFNRDRLRAGDLVAGTWVVKTPKAKLLPDLAEAPVARGAFDFTAAQLQAYGVKELHVLEDVLRGRDAKIMFAVAERIRRKIDWAAPRDERDADFLAAYYAALRGRLEQRLLFGHRRKDKFDRA